MILKYRKLPVVINAVKTPYEMTERMFFRWIDIAKWCKGEFPVDTTDGPKLSITTLEGTMFASCGDYIIQGVDGEFYPCKPDIFEKTYELVTDEQ